MTSRSREGVPRSAIWLGIAILGALTGAALQLVGGGGSSAPAEVLAAKETAQAPAAAASATEVPASVPLPVGAPVAGPPAAATARPAALALDDSASVHPAAPPSAPPTGFRLRIPTLDIDADIVALGFTGDGQLAVPGDAASVGWYEISSRLGEPGNALLGAHFDWDGSLAVFSRLSQLSEGDRVFVDGTTGPLEYVVSASSSVGWDHPVADILATDGTSSSLTLFTCGGTFDSARGEYDERLVVRAVLVNSFTPLTARR